MVSTLNMQRIHLTSPGIKCYRRNLLIAIVVCWFTNQANSSSLSATQYFHPLCNKTYKIPLALPLFLKKNVKNTAEYTSHWTNQFWKFSVHVILQYTYREFRKIWIPTIPHQPTLAHPYIPEPEDLESMLEPKPPLKPLPDPAFDAEPQPIAAPELEPL
jgi:hypothetical protein